MSEHKKHPEVTRRHRGKYHHAEWAIYGTHCGGITALFDRIRSDLAVDYTLLYVDADHHNEVDGNHCQIGKKQLNSTSSHWTEYDDMITGSHADAVLVNGNHYPAERQIVIIDQNKKESLRKRKAQLTNVVAILTDGEELYDFLDDVVNDSIPRFSREDLSDFSTWIKGEIAQCRPSLKALILAGGRSKRMGSDKSQLVYHNGRSQELHMAELCKSLDLEVFISKPHDFDLPSIGYHPVIKDRMIDMGPKGAILSAMMTDPNTAWLVLACDLPLIDAQSIQALIDGRDVSKVATAYKVDKNQFPEPLIAIYEPKSYPRLLSFLSLGYTCPRKMLINSDVKTIVIDDAQKAFNANTPEDRLSITRSL